MPIFQFEGPDGRVHSIEGPEGSTAATSPELATRVLSPPSQLLGGGLLPFSPAAGLLTGRREQVPVLP